MFRLSAEHSRREALLRFIIAGVLALPVPLLVLSSLISLGESIKISLGLPWYVIFAALLLPGVIGIEIAPVGRWIKALLTAIYVPLGAIGVFFYSLWYACEFHGGCL